MNVNSVIKTVKELGYDELRTDYINKTEEIYSKIVEFLNRADVPYIVKEFPGLAPEWEWELKVGEEEIPSLPSGLVSGEIEMNLKDSSDLSALESPNVSFNSHLKSFDDVSTPVFHWAPSISTSKKGIVKILEEGKVEGSIRVKVKSVSVKHILAGNVEKPKKVFVVHYDALWKGVIDNGLSVTLFLNLLKEGKVGGVVLFLGFSEVTLWHKYWEYSMITAKEGFKDVLTSSEVFVVDCIGYRGTDFIKDKEYLEAYSILKEDVRIFGTPMKYLLEVYHSTGDDLNAVSLKQLEEDVRRIITMAS